MTTWMCPYWHKDKQNRITCEAGAVRFPDGESRRAFTAAFCAGDWKQCQMARMMTIYYDRQERSYRMEAEQGEPIC